MPQASCTIFVPLYCCPSEDTLCRSNRSNPGPASNCRIPRHEGTAQGTILCCTGASGGIGQPLSLLLKLNEHVDVLSLYDVVGTPGVGADIGHIDSIAKVLLGCRCLVDDSA